MFLFSLIKLTMFYFIFIFNFSFKLLIAKVTNRGIYSLKTYKKKDSVAISILELKIFVVAFKGEEIIVSDNEAKNFVKKLYFFLAEFYSIKTSTFILMIFCSQNKS